MLFAGYAVLRRRWAWLVAGGLAVAVVDPLCARVLKPAVGRERPCRALAGVEAPNGCGAAQSMPSVHAANTAALAAATGSPLLIGIAALTGASRVVTGVHWPSDVIVGWIVGGVVGGAARGGVGVATRAAMRRLRRRRGRETPEEPPWT